MLLLLPTIHSRSGASKQPRGTAGVVVGTNTENAQTVRAPQRDLEEENLALETRSEVTRADQAAVALVTSLRANWLSSRHVGASQLILFLIW